METSVKSQMSREPHLPRPSRGAGLRTVIAKPESLF